MEQEKERVWEAALAGLLHDIGKFAQRAGEETRGEWRDETPETFKYHHALLTSRFASRLPAQWKKFGEEAALHHQPTTDLSRRIQIADWLASGERIEYEDDSQRESHPPQMLSIFKSVEYSEYGTMQKITGDEKSVHIPIARLELDQKVIFPAERADDPWSAYHALWDEFCGKTTILKQVHEPDGDLETYLESLLLLMQEYTWCVPAAYRNYKADVSLFHHSRMTAALAAILADPEFPDQVWDSLKDDPAKCNEPVALLVGGDLSGVQDFIYTITNKGATSALRGRSFYLQLLTEAAARYILRELGLPITNLIYASGGNFYLFARASDGGNLDQIRQNISRILYKHHRGHLYLAVSSMLVKGEEFFNPDKANQHPFARKWFELGQNLALAKNRRFSELDEDELRTLFEPQLHGGNQASQCIVCGLELEKEEPDEEKRKCPACKSYEELGDDLRYANFLAFKFFTPPAPQSASLAQAGRSWREVLHDFGVDAAILREAGTDAHLLLALNDEALQSLQPGPRLAVGLRLLVNTRPLLSAKEAKEYSTPEETFNKGKIKPFQVLAEQSRGIKRLGILRMDVDNLGQIFAEGLQDATPSRMAALSFAVSLYFEGWVARIAEQVNKDLGTELDEKTKEPRGDTLYAIYSGGDDLFFVGAWDAVVELARRVRRDLMPYAAHHSGIHISGGIALASAKYPLARAAQDAQEAEAQAKSQEWWNDNDKVWAKKDVISFLGQALPWRDFGLAVGSPNPNGRDVASLMHLLKGELERKAANRSILRLMLQLFAQYEEAEEERRKKGGGRKSDGSPQQLWGRWNWLVFYFLRKRLAEGKKGSPLWQMAERLYTNPGLMAHVALAARWAELLTRR